MVRASFKKTIGILGGTGPAATAYAFQRLITLCQTEYGTVQDSDYPNVLVMSYPLKGTSERGYDDNASLKRQLEKRVSVGCATMKKAGADVVYMACNTLHSYRAVLADSGLDDVNIIDATADYIAEHLKGAHIAVISSDATRREQLYKSALTLRGIAFQETPANVQLSVDKLILAAMGGSNLSENRKKLKQVCAKMTAQADYVILGCTELSLLAKQGAITRHKVIDAQEIALRETLRRAL